MSLLQTMRRGGRWLLRVTALLVLGAGCLTMLAWLSIRAGAAPAAARELLQLAPDELSVELDTFELLAVDLFGITEVLASASNARWVDPDGLEFHAENLRVTAAVALDPLVGGDLVGLHAIRLQCDRLRIVLADGDEPSEAASPEDGWLPDPALFAALGAQLFRGGLRADIRQLEVAVAGDDAQLFEGPTSLSLTASPHRRLDVLGAAGSTSIWLPAESTAPGQKSLRAAATLPAPEILAARLGLESPLQGGLLQLSATCRSGACDARLDWRDAELSDDGLAHDLGAGGLGKRARRARLRADLAATERPGAAPRLFADTEIDLPGLRLETEDLEIPWSETTPELGDLRGAVSLSIVDLEPWRDLLPAPVRDCLPLRGVLRGRLDERGLDVDAGHLSMPGVRWNLADGRLPADLDEPGRIESELILRGSRDIPLGDFGTAQLRGNATLIVQGSLAAPQFDVTLDLAEGSVTQRAPAGVSHAFASLRGAIGWRSAPSGPDRLDVASLEFTGLRNGTRPASEFTGEGLSGSAAFVAAIQGGDAVLSGRADLAGPLGAWAEPQDLEATIDGPAFDWSTATCERLMVQAESLQLRTDDSCELPVGSLTAILFGLRATPDRPPTTLRLDLDRPAGHAGPAGSPDRFAARLRGRLDPYLLTAVPARDFGRADRGWQNSGFETIEPVPLEFEARGIWSGTGRPRGNLTLSLDHVAAPDLPTGSAFLALETGRDSVTLQSLALRGAIRADGRGRLQFEPAAAAAAAPTAAATATGDLDLRAEIVDAAALRLFWPDLPTDLAAHCDVHVHGPLDSPRLRARAEVALPPSPARDAWLPWPTDAGLRAPSQPLRIQLQLDSLSGEPARTRVVYAAGDPDQDAAGVRAEAWGSLPIRFDTATGQLIPTVASGLVGSVRAVSYAEASGKPARLLTRWAWDGQQARAERIEIATEDFGVRGSATLGVGLVDLVTAMSPADALQTAPLIADLRLDRVDLSKLPVAVDEQLGLAGSVGGWLRLEGPAAAPRPTGRVSLHRGRIRIAPDVPSLANLEGTLEIREDRLLLRDLIARMGIGHVRLGGTLRFAEPGRPALTGSRLDVKLQATDALLLRGTGLKLRAGGGLQLSGTVGSRLDLTGALTATSGKLIRRISLVPDFGTRGGASVGSGLPLFELPEPWGDQLHFAVTIRNTAPLELQTYVCDLKLDPALQLRGTGSAPYLEGAVAARSGVLRLPALAMEVEHAVLQFDATSPRQPRVAIRARARRHGIDLRATATGRLDQMEILLSSLPPLTQQELYALVSTGVLPDTLRREGLQGRMTMVGGYVASEILDFYFGSDSTERGPGLADRFHFEAGREISRGGVESLIVDFDLDDNFALRGERDIYEDYNMGLVYRFRF